MSKSAWKRREQSRCGESKKEIRDFVMHKKAMGESQQQARCNPSQIRSDGYTSAKEAKGAEAVVLCRRVGLD